MYTICPISQMRKLRHQEFTWLARSWQVWDWVLGCSILQDPPLIHEAALPQPGAVLATQNYHICPPRDHHIWFLEFKCHPVLFRHYLTQRRVQPGPLHLALSPLGNVQTHCLSSPHQSAPGKATRSGHESQKWKVGSRGGVSSHNPLLEGMLWGPAYWKSRPISQTFPPSTTSVPLLPAPSRD